MNLIKFINPSDLILSNKRLLVLIIISLSNLGIDVLKSNEIKSGYGSQNQISKNIPEKEIKIIDKNQNFLILPNTQKINKYEDIGKSDIFSFEGFENKSITSAIKLLGVYSTKKGAFAIINFNNQIGEVKKGDIGDKDTKLIPKDYKLVEIDLDKFSINIESTNNSFEIKG